MKRILILALLLLSVAGVSQAQDKANWTILYYGIFDNDLEAFGFSDYYEMQTAGSGEGVNIVVQADRAEGHDDRFGDWTDTRRFYIEQRPSLPKLDVTGMREALMNFFVDSGYDDTDAGRAEVAQLDDEWVSYLYYDYKLDESFEQIPVEELGEVDMGDPQSLVDFLVWGANNHPADHYMVVMSGHGGGWTGIGPDEGGGEASNLELPEIDAALEAARAELGIEKFDIAGFDACLMAITDVALMLEPHADYVLFSQEIVPGKGWEYTKSIDAMRANPDWDAFQVGATFVDNYIADYTDSEYTQFGLSLVETAGLPTLLSSLENFAQVIEADTVELLSALGSARNNSQMFGTILGGYSDQYAYVDLKDFMMWFSLQTTITDAAYSAALEVVAAYDGAVVYSQAASVLPGANGLGVYLPSTPDAYEGSGENYPAMAPESFVFWQDYLNQFYSTITTELDGSALQLEIKDVFTVGENGSSVDTPIISFDAAGKGVVTLEYSITYVEDDGTRTIVDMSPLSYTSILPTGETLIEYPNELTPSTFTWSAEFPYVSDGSSQVLSVLSPQSGGNNGTVWGTYVNSEGSQQAYLVFAASTFEYMGIVAIVDGAVYEPSPTPGDQFIVDLISITDEGEKIHTPQTDTPLTFGLQPFTFAYLPAESGNYEAGLKIADLAGNFIRKEVDITINNEGVDATLRGYTDTNEGVYFQYPHAWGESDLFTHDDGSSSLSVSDDEGVQSLFVDAYPETDAQTVLDSVLSLVDGDISAVTETTLGGLPAYSASYATVLEDGSTNYATLYSVFNAESGSAVVFTLQSSVEDAALDAPVMTMLDWSLQLFAPRLE